MKKHFRTAAVAAVAFVPLLVLAFVWEGLPQTVPMHYGTDLKPDGFGDRAGMWVPAVILAVVSLALYLLLTNLHRIDPKRKGNGTARSFRRLGTGLVLFFTALNLLFIAMAAGLVGTARFLLPLVGCLFAFIGNNMLHIKPNYFAGLRLPWTLSSDENWRRTHALGGRLWFGGGLLIALVCFFLPPAAGFTFFLVITLLLTVVPIVYSFRLFKQQH